MSDAGLWSAWGLWMAVAGVIVLVAAGLLITIWLTARSILAHAGRALAAAEAIRENTQPIWALQTTNEVAAGLLASVEGIEAKASALVVALADPANAGQAAGAAGRTRP
ncbi:MAG: hypothetical protein ABIS20_25165 [Thermoanaerobaculia bacterium]